MTKLDDRITLLWLPADLEEIREALGHGADETAWPPGLTMGQSVRRLVGLVQDLRAAIDNAPCLVARPGELTYECSIERPCRVCVWRSDTTRVLREEHGMM